MSVYLTAAVALLSYMLLAWLVATYLSNNTVADIAYGGAFIVVALTSTLLHGSLSLARCLLLIALTLWASRLTYRMLRRSLGKSEDFRYAQWRQEWKYPILRSLFQVYILQGTIVYIVALPLLVALQSDRLPHMVLLTVGLLLFTVGLAAEIRADYEVDAFRSDIKNHWKLLTTGLRRYVRHPQYLGESMLWWGLTFASLSLVPQNGWYVVLLLCPLLITLIIRFVSGVPLLEARLSRHSDWVAYAQRTPAMFSLERFALRKK